MKSYLKNSKPYLIAETAYGFEGDSAYLIEQTKRLSSKADAIKYHMMFNTSDYVVGAYELKNLLDDWLIKESEWLEVLKAAKENNKDVIVLADDTDSIEFCEKNNHLVDAIEVHAACVNDKCILDRALEFARDYDKVMMLGISGFEIDELQTIIEYIKSWNIENLLLIYGFQNFPTKVENINLTKIPLFKTLFDCSIGYADHTEHSSQLKEQLIGTSFALGANIQEIHYVLNEGEKRTDAVTAIGNQRIESIKEMLENIEISLGTMDFRLNAGEKSYLNYRKVPVLKNAVTRGDKLTEELIVYKRVEKPSYQHKFGESKDYIGMRFSDNFDAETELLSTMLIKE